MGKGPGRVQREIVAAFAADPDNGFTINELCCLIYPDSEYIEKKHTVAILKAAKSLAKRWPDFGWERSERRGRGMVFFNAANMMSWAMARLKGDYIYIYDEEFFRASLLPGGENHRYIVEGGAWRRHRDMWIARRDGDTAALKRLEAEQEQSMTAILPSLRADSKLNNPIC
jgi:hypothetical protein